MLVFLLSWVSAFLTDEEVGFFFYFQFSLKVNSPARAAWQSLAKINNRRGDHWSSFFLYRWFLAFFLARELVFPFIFSFY